MKVYHEQYPDEADNYELRNRKGGTKVAHKGRSKNISEDESDDNEKDSDRDSNHDEDDDDFPASNTDGLVLEKLDERDDFEESNLDDRTPGRFSQPVVVTDLKKRTTSSHSQSGRNASLKRHLSSPLSAQRRKKMHQTSNITSTYHTPQVQSKCTLIHPTFKCKNPLLNAETKHIFAAKNCPNRLCSICH